MFTWIVAVVGIILAFVTLGRIKSQKTFSGTITQLEKDREDASKKTEASKKEYEAAKQEVAKIQEDTKTLIAEEAQHEEEYHVAVQDAPEEIVDVPTAIQRGNDIIAQRRSRRSAVPAAPESSGSVDD